MSKSTPTVWVLLSVSAEQDWNLAPASSTSPFVQYFNRACTLRIPSNSSSFLHIKSVSCCPYTGLISDEAEGVVGPCLLVVRAGFLRSWSVCMVVVWKIGELGVVLDLVTGAVHGCWRRRYSISSQQVPSGDLMES